MLQICSSSKFVSHYEKKDPYFRILSEIISSGVSSEHPESLVKGGNFGLIQNQFKSTGIGFYVKFNNTDNYMSFSGDASELLNMNILYPTPLKQFEAFGAPNSTVTVLAMRQSSVGSYWFNLPVKCFKNQAH